MTDRARRRALAGKANEPAPSSLIFSLYNRAVSDGDVIDTGVSPFASGTSMTILLDISISKNPTDTSQAYRWRLLDILRSSGSGIALFVGKPSQWNAAIRALIGNATATDDNAKIATASAGRKRIVITHESNSSSIVAIGKVGDGTPTIKTVSNNQISSSTSHLTLGAVGTGYGLPPATINSIEVYSEILGQEAIDQFLA